MEKISAVIITYNEEKNILNCINSLKNIADEIIVLDSYSTDKTEEICISQNVKFFKHTFDGHIQQKNRALEYATHNYVLSLDADEMLSQQLKKSILEIKNNFSSDAYFFNRLNFFNQKKIKHGGWYPDKKIRLWNKNKGKWGGENPHDTVILQPNSTKTFLKGDLLHFTFHSISQHVAQINKFSDIKAIAALNKNYKTSYIKIIFKPFFKFILIYFIKAGFLDGHYGFVIAVNSAHFEFLRQVKTKEMQKNKFKQ